MFPNPVDHRPGTIALWRPPVLFGHTRAVKLLPRRGPQLVSIAPPALWSRGNPKQDDEARVEAFAVEANGFDRRGRRARRVGGARVIAGSSERPRLVLVLRNTGACLVFLGTEVVVQHR